MLIEEIKKELSEITKKIEEFSSEDEELMQWKLAEFKKDVLLLKFLTQEMISSLETHKKSIDNR